MFGLWGNILGIRIMKNTKNTAKVFKKGDKIENQLWKNLTVVCMDGNDNVWVEWRGVSMRFHTSWMEKSKGRSNDR